MNAIRKGLLTIAVAYVVSGCLNESLQPSQAPSPSATSSPLILTIADAKLDISSNRIIMVLEFRVRDGELPFNRYDPEYEISVNGESFIPLGPIRWRHPFGLKDLIILSGEKDHFVNYYYELRNLSVNEVRTIAMKVRRADGNAVLLNTLKSLGCADPDRYANTWHGMVVSQQFVVEHLDGWHSEIGRVRFREGHRGFQPAVATSRSEPPPSLGPLGDQ